MKNNKTQIKSILVISFLLLTMVFSCEKEPLLDDSSSINTNPIIIVDIKKIDIDNNYASLYAVISDLDGNCINVGDSNITVGIEKNGIVEIITGHTFNKNDPNYNVKIRSVLVMDYSGSVDVDSTDIMAMENTAKELINLKSNIDEMAIIKFDDDVVLTQEFTFDDVNLINAVENDLIFGKTSALYEACLNGINYCASTSDTLDVPVVIALTDGNNNRYPFDVNTVIDASLINQIPVYTLGYGHSELEPADTVKLQYIANTTGGEYHWSPNYNTVAGLYQRIPNKKKFVVIGFPLNKINTVQTIVLNVMYLNHNYIAKKDVFY